MGVTGANIETAANCLGAYNWKLEQAINGYFEDSDAYRVAPSAAATDGASIETLYQKYQGSLHCAGRLCPVALLPPFLRGCPGCGTGFIRQASLRWWVGG